MSVETEYHWGALLVRDDSLQRRFWFDVTDKENLILASIVTGMDHSRHYHDREDWNVPVSVAMALDAEGYDHAYGPDGSELV